MKYQVMKNRFINLAARLVPAVALICFCALSSFAQQTTGNVRGIVRDQAGAVVTGASVTITNVNTNATTTAQTTDDGEYQFSDLLPGEYSIRVEAPNFKTLNLSDVRVQLNQTTDVPTALEVGGATEVVEVSAGGAELVDTTTANLSKSFSERQVVELAQTNVGGAFGGGVNNLSLLAPNVSSSGGVGVGTGGSVGGQRPRNNNFIVDGVDNNDKSVTGPQVYVSPEVVQEFSLLQNQFSAEFARSNGGQFITVTRSGTNDFSGSVFGFFRNRYLNALEPFQKEAGIVRERNVPGTEFMPRSDFGRFGFRFGGPVVVPRSDANGKPAFAVLRDKLFFFTSYERLQLGSAASPAGITAPTAEGFRIINSLPGLAANNLSVFNQLVPVAPVNNIPRDPDNPFQIGGVDIPLGTVTFAAPNFLRQNSYILNFDFVQSENTQHRTRFNYTDNFDIDTTAPLTQFFALSPNQQRLFSYTLVHNFSPNVTNETRLAYRRSVSDTPAGALTFPGLDVFPNITLADLGALNIGPNENAPQSDVENNYQIVNNLTVLAGNHSFKFGGDFRKLISPQTFVQRSRGDYIYNTTDRFLRDLSPDDLAQRSVGASPYAGNQKILYLYAQDDYRVRPNLTLNLGLTYNYQEVPLGANLQSLNSISSVPGLVEFREPKEQLKNFAPKVGFAYSPNFDSGVLGSVFGTNGKSSLRAGFSLGYDYIFDNLYILSLPPQAQQTVDLDTGITTSGFFASGAIPNVTTGGLNDAATARAVTASFIPDQEVPYSITYTASFQRQFLKNYAFELRYLGTRGVHLLTQNRVNRQVKASEAIGGLPTFLSAPTQAQLDAMTLTLNQINARSSFVPAYANAGFNQTSLVGFLSNGNSTYHAGSAQLTRRFADNFNATAAYTWSHLIDDTTAEVFSTVLSPRRVEDFQDLRRERADSALDRRHRFVLSAGYELPFFRTSNNGFVRTVLGGFQFVGTYSAESGQKATVLSGVDSNLNGDSAADRTIINPSGVRGTDSLVTPLRNTGGQIVGYLATNPNAQYIQAGAGAISNSARNTLQLPGINNLDLSIFKNFRFGETRKIQLRADMFNAANHPQYIPGSINDVSPVSTTGVTDINTVGRTDFNRPNRVFNANSRVVQLALRFDF